MPDLRYDRFPGGQYAIFTMDRPGQLSAQGAAMRQESGEALNDFAAGPELRVEILRQKDRGRPAVRPGGVAVSKLSGWPTPVWFP